jgi:hypothetical protein
MRSNLVKLLTSPPYVKKWYLDNYTSDSKDSHCIQEQLTDRTRRFVNRIFKRLGWTRLDTLFDSIQRFDGLGVKAKQEFNMIKGTEMTGHPPSPSIFDTEIPGVEDEVDIESESTIIGGSDTYSPSLIEYKGLMIAPKDLKLRNDDDDDTASSVDSRDIVEATSDNSTDTSEPLLIQEWREAQQKRRKRRRQGYMQEQTNDFSKLKRLTLKIDKLKVKMEHLTNFGICCICVFVGK